MNNWMTFSGSPLQYMLSIFIAILRAIFAIFVKLLASVLGLVVVLIALPFSKKVIPPEIPTTVSRIVADGWQFIRLPLWADWCWGNDKYGAEGNWFWNAKTFWRRYWWLAIRNPANNLQRYSLFRFNANPAQIRYLGTNLINDVKGIPGWQLVWQGSYAGMYILLPYSSTRCFKLRIGYKIDPSALKPTSASLSFIVNPWARFGS